MVNESLNVTSSASEASDGDESFSNAEILTVMAAIANATLYEELEAEAIPKKFDSLGREYPGSMRISISDTGIGVALDKQSKIFEAFYKVDGSHTARYEGTGIGLTISKGLIEAMGGQVNFFSLGEDLGSTVTLTIPLQQLPIIIKD